MLGKGLSDEVPRCFCFKFLVSLLPNGRNCEKAFDGFQPSVRLAAMVLKDIKLPVNLPIKREQMVFETAAAIT